MIANQCLCSRTTLSVTLKCETKNTGLIQIKTSSHVMKKNPKFLERIQSFNKVNLGIRSRTVIFGAVIDHKNLISSIISFIKWMNCKRKTDIKPNLKTS